MPNEFAITAAAGRVTLDANRRGQAIFTVSSMTDRPLRARARVVPFNPEAESWFTISEPERDIAVAATQQFAVDIAVPPAALARDYTIRLDVVGVELPDEQYAQGPGIIVAVPAPPLPTKKPFPWWIVAVAGATLLLITAGAVALLTLGDDDDGGDGGDGVVVGPISPRITAVQEIVIEDPEGTLQMSGETFVDLDDGSTQNGGQIFPEADFKIGSQNILASAIEPLNGALIGFAGESAPEEEGCAALELESAPITFEEVTDGNHFCIRTTEGNLSQLRIDDVTVFPTQPRTFALIRATFVTFER